MDSLGQGRWFHLCPLTQSEPSLSFLPHAPPKSGPEWTPRKSFWGSVMPLQVPWLLGRGTHRTLPSLPVWQHNISPSLLRGFGTRLNCWNLQGEALWGCIRGQGAFSSQEDLLLGVLALYNQQAHISTSLNLGDCVQKHEAVLQVLQSLNVVLVMPGQVKGGQGPAARSTTRPQRLSWAHDPNLQHTISVWRSISTCVILFAWLF